MGACASMHLFGGSFTQQINDFMNTIQFLNRQKNGQWKNLEIILADAEMFIK
jgi:hypothetical protein